MGGKERRKAFRYGVWFPMQIENEKDVILGVSRDISTAGILAVTTAKPEVGATVSISMMLPNGELEHFNGTIIRISDNIDDAEGAWPHRVAVAFEKMIPELEKVLKEVSDSMLPPPQ